MSRDLKENVWWVYLENKVNCTQDIRLIIIIEAIYMCLIFKDSGWYVYILVWNMNF